MGLTVITGAGGLWGKPDNVLVRHKACQEGWQASDDGKGVLGEAEVDQFRKRVAEEVLAVSSGWGARTQASQDTLRAVGIHPLIRGGGEGELEWDSFNALQGSRPLGQKQGISPLI